ncbi:hypothetical protein M7I_6090 [Glarea lozoyensis 74030]|uniref:Uncharacterized protein n=1 Tax=Glarea lozoyensis (strain ATCC 74030 / MF5533) TaxID=1104152 RepID=H0ETM5_GLAL7|nr:hypothetical protein M7I_6090 [Glarea lozoyensis 74030]
MVQDELGRLKIWAGNIAAHRNGKVSLDHRLRDATPLRGRIVSLLDDMSEILQEDVFYVSKLSSMLSPVN